jgi:hypothetical protein
MIIQFSANRLKAIFTYFLGSTDFIGFFRCSIFFRSGSFTIRELPSVLLGRVSARVMSVLPNRSTSMNAYLNDTHLKSDGYILWLFGFIGSHRFYYGKQITGTIWFFTLGLLGIGWLVD